MSTVCHAGASGMFSLSVFSFQTYDMFLPHSLFSEHSILRGFTVIEK